MAACQQPQSIGCASGRGEGGSFLIQTLGNGGGGGYGVGDPWITFGSFLDHFRPFCSLYFQLCANGLVDLCIVFWKPNCWNKSILHFWIIYNTHCWFNMLLCTCTMSHLCLEVAFLDHFCEHESVDHLFFGTYVFGSHFFHTNWWIISFLELSETEMIQKRKFQKRNDPPICVEKI